MQISPKYKPYYVFGIAVLAAGITAYNVIPESSRIALLQNAWDGFVSILQGNITNEAFVNTFLLVTLVTIFFAMSINLKQLPKNVSLALRVLLVTLIAISLIYTLW